MEENSLSTSSVVKTPDDQSEKKRKTMKKQRRKAQIWSETEDKLLLSAVNKYGVSNWVEIAKYVGTRTRKQCRERYVNHVCPFINTRNWTADEDSFILKAHDQMKDRWCSIAKSLDGRTARAVRNRYFTLVSKPKTCFVPSSIPFTVIIGGVLSWQ